FALRQQRADEQDGADEAAQHPEDRQVEMLGADDVEVQRSGQQRRVEMLGRKQQAEAGLEEEQHQHDQEEAQGKALGLVFDPEHGSIPPKAADIGDDVL